MLLVIGTSLSYADTIPSLVWTDDTTFTESVGFASDDPFDAGLNGISSTAGCSLNPGGCAELYMAERTFTVTSAGLFTFSTAASAGVSVFSDCLPVGGCSGTAFASVDFTDTDSIIGPESFAQNVSGDISNSQDCNGSIFGCGASANADGSAMSAVYLPLGDYTLEQNMNFVANGSGDSTGSDQLITAVLPGAPTPEPRGTIVVLTCGLIALLTLKSRRKTL